MRNGFFIGRVRATVNADITIRTPPVTVTAYDAGGAVVAERARVAFSSLGAPDEPGRDAQDSPSSFFRTLKAEPTAAPRATPSETPMARLSKAIPKTAPKTKPRLIPKHNPAPGGMFLLVIASLPGRWAEG
ncbi:hypothetical protein GCM10022419_062560 [Nonomuraea rosea]|uniref:Uncharacterized protein n=1 Tax=Nonomuraea rosea TaxID=638574 RepID=A0ABP6XV68_9ACTN